LGRSFNTICTDICFRSRTSACCSKDGIITFFADAVINALNATDKQQQQLMAVLEQVNTGHRCVYLGEAGCLWTVRPVVCAMYLCDRATKAVFDEAPEARATWERLREQEKRFNWPDRPVLFDHLERVFLDMEYRSTLMHLNLSPGLLRVKQNAGLI
jgi:putative NADH-flavin reductase